MPRIVALLSTVGASVLAGLPCSAAPPPTSVGSCSSSFVQSKRFRLVPSPGDVGYRRTADDGGKEVLIRLTNGVAVFAGLGDAFILSRNFRAGHPVRVCLQSKPSRCPPGDQRGKRYRIEDTITGARVLGPDSWHLCGGA